MNQRKKAKLGGIHRQRAAAYLDLYFEMVNAASLRGLTRDIPYLLRLLRRLNKVRARLGYKPYQCYGIG